MPKDKIFSGDAYLKKKNNMADSLNPNPEKVIGVLPIRITNGTYNSIAYSGIKILTAFAIK